MGIFANILDRRTNNRVRRAGTAASRHAVKSQRIFANILDRRTNSKFHAKQSGRIFANISGWRANNRVRRVGATHTPPPAGGLTTTAKYARRHCERFHEVPCKTQPATSKCHANRHKSQRICGVVRDCCKCFLHKVLRRLSIGGLTQVLVPQGFRVILLFRTTAGGFSPIFLTFQRIRG